MSTDPSITETLRSLAASTVRGILQTAGVQAISSEIRQQATTLRPISASPNASGNTHLISSADTSSTKVELSAAAKFPPLASITAPAAVLTRPSDVILSAALPLPATLGMLDLQGNSEQTIREVMQLAVKLGQAMKLWQETPRPLATRETAFRRLTTHISAINITPDHLSHPVAQEIMTPIDHGGVDMGRMDSVKPEVSALRADAQKLEALYAQNGAQAYARVDVSPLPSNSNTANTQEAAFAATLQVKLPVLGDMVITLALNETRSDLAFAASPATLELLKLTQAQFRQAASAWGLNVQGLSFIPFVKQGENS